MVCEQPTVAEKLVPYVEGALAEPDRSEVLEHLRMCEACQAEVRVLKDSILGLRRVFSGASAYRHGSHLEPSELESFAFEPERLEPAELRRVKLHLADCPECADEVLLLREMEQELAEKVEPVRAPDALPAVLVDAITKQFGVRSTREKAAPRPWIESLTAFLAGFSPKPLMAAAGAVAVIFVGFQFVQPSPSSAPKVAQVAQDDSLGKVQAPAPPARQTASKADEAGLSVPQTSDKMAAAAPGGVGEAAIKPALPKDAAPSPVKAKDGLVALLPVKVDPQDLPRFSKQLWDHKVSHSYKEGQIFVEAKDVDKARSALQLGPREMAAVDLKVGREQTPSKAAASAESKAGSPSIRAAAADQRRLNERTGPTPAARPQTLAQAPPPPHSKASPPDLSAGLLARANLKKEEPPAEPRKREERTPAVSRQLANRDDHAVALQPSKPAVGGPVGADVMTPSPKTNEIAVLVPKAGGGEARTPEASPHLANPRQQVARPPVQMAYQAQAGQAAEKPAPEKEKTRDKGVAAEGYSADTERTPAAPPPPAPPTGHMAPSRAASATLAQGPPSSKVALNTGAVPLNAPSGAAGRAPANKLDDGVAMADTGQLAVQARKIASDTLQGEFTVSIDVRDGGRVVTVRAPRTLTSLEVDKLRKALRQGLGLGDSDTVVIRQP